jgi:apolipoprotein N-acyltransferase
MIIAVLYCSLNIIVICLIMRILKNHYPKRWFWLIPFIWTSVEYIRNMDILTGGPWTALANTQLDFLTLAQNAEITGIYGISFWIVAINILLFNFLVRPYPANSFSTISIFIMPWLTGLWLTPQVQTDNVPSVDVAVVQPNIHLSQKWKPGGARENISSLIEYSEPAIADDVDLIVWPESATSVNILKGNPYNLNRIQSSLDDTKLISGIPYNSGYGLNRFVYNSVVMISSDSVSELYHKMKLVPLAEYIPLSEYFPFLKKYTLGILGNCTRGEEYTLYDVKDAKFAPMVCIESAFPSLNREFVKNGAEVLVYVVNDGWYERPPEPQQHAKQAVYRAIENRRPVIRCTNTGISMIIDAGGNISHELPLNEKGMIQATIKPQNISTFYTRHGDIFAQLNLLISILFILGGIIRKK